MPYLAAFARLLGAHFHAAAAGLDPSRAPLARLAARHLLPEVPGLLAQAEAGAARPLRPDRRPPLPMSLDFPFPDPPAPGAAVEVARDIFWLRLPLPMALDHVNVYALADADGWTLIDTGLDSRKTRALWEAALAGPLAGRRVHRLIVTHHHPDHVGLAGWFQSMGAELMMTRTAWLYARMLTLDVQERPTDEALAFLRRAGVGETTLRQRAGERPFNFADVVAPMPLGFTRLCRGTRDRGRRSALAGAPRLGPRARPRHASGRSTIRW